MTILRILVGIPIIVACVFMMKYTVRLTDITGKIEYAEKYLGFPFAGTYSFYRILAIIFIVGTLFWMGGFFSIFPSSDQPNVIEQLQQSK